MKLFGHEINSLYHATYKAYIESIKEMGGLVPDVNKNWDISRKGVIYFCNNPAVAASFCETAEYVPEEWLDEIIVYEVDVSKLNINKFQPDENWSNDLDDALCFTYEGIIPLELLIENNYQ